MFGPDRSISTLRTSFQDMWDLTQQPLKVPCPVTIVHGPADTSVPFEETLKLQELIESDAGLPEVVAIKNGSNRCVCVFNRS